MQSKRSGVKWTAANPMYADGRACFGLRDSCERLCYYHRPACEYVRMSVCVWTDPSIAT